MRTSLFFTVAFAALLAVNGQCPQASYVCPTTPISVPTPWYSLDFASDPRSAVGGPGSAAAYSWRQTADNDRCAAYHTGMLELLGSAARTNDPVAPWVNLTAPSGAYSVGRTLPAFPLIGNVRNTPGSYELGTKGWSFEATFRANREGDLTQWSKVVSLGTNERQFGTQCNGEWTFGWHDSTDDLTLVTCTNNNEHKVEHFLVDADDLAWYHIVSVIQQSPNGWATYSVYVNGELKGTREDSQPLLEIYRDRAVLGRSSWNDMYFNGTIDHFAIYDIALTPMQALGLHGARMANCSIAVAPYTNATQATEAVTPFFDATFSSDITTFPSVPADFSWLASDPEDAGCALNSHRGLLSLAGDADYIPASRTAGPYVNLSSSGGENYIGQTLNTFGGVTAGQGALGSTAGFSVEVSFKASFQYPYSKIWAVGNADSVPCLPGDFWAGWRASDYALEMMYCDANRATRTIVSRNVPLYLRTWHHLVVSVQAQPNSASTNLAQWTIILDGRVVAVVGSQYMPTAIPRKNNLLGRSLYYGTTDTYFSGFLDRFAVYPRALSVAQAAALAASSGTGSCPQLANTLSTLPASAQVYANSWNTDPRPAGGAAYGWLQFDANDTAIDQQRHRGILLFGPGAGGRNSGQQVNLTATSGPNSAGTIPLPWIGGEGTGNFTSSTKGWTIEITFKILPTPTTVYDNTTLQIADGPDKNGQTWTKVMDLGDGNKGSGRDQCENDVIWTFFEGTNYMRFEVCNTVNYGSNVGGTRRYPMKVKTWYHAVLTQRLTPNGPIGSIYLNGEHIESSLMANYPLFASRQDGRLAGSSWNDPQWSGMISYFAIHSQGVNQNQATALYTRAITPDSSSSSAGAVSSAARSSSSSTGVSSSAASVSSSTSVSSSAASVSSSPSSSASVTSIATGTSARSSSSTASNTVVTSPSTLSSTGFVTSGTLDDGNSSTIIFTSVPETTSSSTGIDDGQGGNGVGHVTMSIMSVLLVVVASFMSM